MNSRTENTKFQFFRTVQNQIVLKIAYVAFSLYSILYTIFLLSFFQLTIFPTINRITYTETLQWSLTGTIPLDILLSSIFFVIGVLTVFKKNISIPLVGIVMGFSVLGITNADNFSEISSFVFAASLPVVMALTIIPKIIFLNSKKEIV